MSSHFYLKTHQSGKPLPEEAFFIQSRGKHSGRPLREPIPNCFQITPRGATKYGTLYWLTYCLWKTNAFHPHLIGSVIPFLRLEECRKLIAQSLYTVQRDPEALHKSITLITDLEKKRQHFQSMAQHLDALHEAVLLRLLNPA